MSVPRWKPEASPLSSYRHVTLDPTKSHFYPHQSIEYLSWKLDCRKGAVFRVIVLFHHFEGVHEFCPPVWKRILVLGIL